MEGRLECAGGENGVAGVSALAERALSEKASFW